MSSLQIDEQSCMHVELIIYTLFYSDYYFINFIFINFNLFYDLK